LGAHSTPPTPSLGREGDARADSECVNTQNPWEEFRKVYPEPKRSVGVERGRRAYIGRISAKPGEHEKLMEGLGRHLVCDQWVRSLRDDNGQSIPAMERFIADGRYLQCPPAPEAVKPAESDSVRWVPPPEPVLTPEEQAEQERVRRECAEIRARKRAQEDRELAERVAQLDARGIGTEAGSGPVRAAENTDLLPQLTGRHLAQHRSFAHQRTGVIS